MNAPPRPPADRRRIRKASSSRPGQNGSAEAQRLEAEQHPGLPVRIAAAAIFSDIVAKSHSLEDCFSARAIPARLGGLDARDVALARSIVTVALRRLGTIRAALGRASGKGLAAPGRAARMGPDRRRRANSFSGRSRSRRRRPRRPHDACLSPRRAPYAALVNGVLRNLARERERDPRAKRSARS